MVCHDAETGKELGDYATLARTIEALEREREEREKAIEEAVLRCHAVEREARAQTAAREKAEEDGEPPPRPANGRSRRPGNGRTLCAEEEARLQAQARERAEQEAHAREARIRELEEALRRL